MKNKHCDVCGKVLSSQSNFSCHCGLKFSITSGGKSILKTTDLLTTSGSIIALVGGVIGIIVSEHYSSVIGFTPIITFITSIFGVASFAYSTSGLILMIRKNLSNKNE